MITPADHGPVSLFKPYKPVLAPADRPATPACVAIRFFVKSCREEFALTKNLLDTIKKRNQNL
jgi:hypothetical protein